MRPRRFVASVPILLLALLVPAAAASAGPQDGNNGGTSVDLIEPYVEDGELKIAIAGDGSVVTVLGGSLPEWMRACRWDVMDWYDTETYFASVLGGTLASREELEAEGFDVGQELNVVFCPVTPESRGIAPAIIITGVLETFPVGGIPPQIIQDWIVAQAVASIPIPVQIGQSAPFGNDAAPMITQFPSWLWVDSAVWQPVSATPPAVFGTTATATATPYRVEFFGPDDEHADCGNNTGPVYDFSVAEEAQWSECTVTFHDSSSVGEFELVSKIYWEISWVCSQFCGSGTLDAPFTTTRTRTVRVAELQAVGTSIGSESS